MRKFLSSSIAWLMGLSALGPAQMAAPELFWLNLCKKKVAKRRHHVDRSKYMPHNGEQEKARRRRQMGRAD
ncbi:hypothetical protein [Labrenzia sp. R5_0]|uniref:hypothetical protein n=1 Tax=Labrenzia sp. R5_0 TaxID=2821108 RepID=UPI001ADC6673|nr:hypothetical protein [Labrenzia sp. R5_0]MBO9458955.1 hypothetical protein [Labrenzia sp. R5_0]